MKLSQKLILGFVSVALLVAVVGYISVGASQKALQKTIGENSVLLAQETLGAIDRIIYRRIERWQSYSASNPGLKQTIIESNQEFENLDNIQKYINEKDRAWRAAEKQEELLFTQELTNNKLSEALRIRANFYKEKYEYDVFPEVFVTNKFGANAAQTGKTTDYYQADERWWQNAKKDGLYVEDVEYDESADVYSLALCMRIDGVSGDFLGVMKVILNIRDIIDILKRFEPGGYEQKEYGRHARKEHETTEFKLLTKDGKIIYSTEGAEFFEDTPPKLFSVLHKTKGCTGYFIAEGDKPGEGEELFAHAHSKGYKDFGGLGWILIVEHKTDEIFAPVVKLRKRILAASMTITILAIGLGLVISKTISRPIDKLASAAAEIGRGKLDTRLEVRSKDEIGQLADSFNKMAEDLQKTTTSIDRLNTANQQLESENAERKKAEGELKQAAEEWQRTFDATSDFVFILDKDFGIVKANRAFAEAFKVKPEDIIGKKCYELLHQSDKPWPGCPFTKSRKDKTPHTEEVYDPGIGIPLLVTISPIFDNNGNFVGAVHYAKDIAERKKAEEALEASNRELALAVNKLEEANRDLKDFVYIASHDLREPMRKISSFGELLKDSLEDSLADNDQENLEFMIDGADRMTAMIDGLLTYSRIATRTVAFGTADLNEIVEQLEQVELAELLEETGAAIEVPQQLPKVQADPVQIRQLLQNLVINGIRYRREGIQPRIVIRAEQIADGQVRVEVEDNGIGIAKEYKDDVFKMFRRLHSRQKYEGTGIGLAVCKKIVERHNGQIGVESEAGAGSTFWFTLPVSDSSRQEQTKLVSSLET